MERYSIEAFDGTSVTSTQTVPINSSSIPRELFDIALLLGTVVSGQTGIVDLLEKSLYKLLAYTQSELGGIMCFDEAFCPKDGTTGQSHTSGRASADSSASTNTCVFLVLLTSTESSQHLSCPSSSMNNISFGHSTRMEIVISDDTERDPRSTGIPHPHKRKGDIKSCNHPRIKNFVSFPLRYGTTIFGQMSMGNTKGAYDIATVSAICTILHLIANASYYEYITKSKACGRQITEIQRENEAKDKFLAIMSHELRTPLNGIMGMITMLEDAGSMNSKQREYVKHLTECTIQLTTLLNNILDFAKMSSNKLTLTKTPVDISRVCSRSMGMIEGKAASKGVKTHVDVPSDVPMVIGDEQRLTQILTNLLWNAVKFTEMGAITLRVRVYPVDSEAVLTKWKAVFEVIDTGIGVPKDEQEKIFGAFYQATTLDSYLSRHGTGLGLSICRELTRIMDGHIEVESSGVAGKGSTFRFFVIFEEQINLRTVDMSLLRDKRIMVIDDRSEMRIQICEMLYSWKCIPMSIGDPLEALQLLRSGRFDTVLIDMCMPNMNGIELAECIRREHISIPLIGLSSVDAPGFNRHFDKYLRKPVDRNALLGVLLECIHQPKSRIPSRNGSGRHSKNQRSGSCDGMSRSTSRTDQPKKSSRAKPDVRVHRSKAHILIAEDDYHNSFILKEMLHHLGFRKSKIDVVENGKLCVDKIRDTKRRYDIVLMDILMPVMDGIEATIAIRNTIVHPPAIIAISAAVQDSEKNKCKQAGIVHFVDKPVTKDVLAMVLANYVKSSRLKRSSNDGSRKRNSTS